MQEEEITAKMTLVDWRWAARNGFWNKSEKRWNSAKGGFQGYLQQRKLSTVTARRPPPDRPGTGGQSGPSSTSAPSLSAKKTIVKSQRDTAPSFHAVNT